MIYRILGASLLLAPFTISMTRIAMEYGYLQALQAILMVAVILGCGLGGAYLLFIKGDL